MFCLPQRIPACTIGSSVFLLHVTCFHTELSHCVFKESTLFSIQAKTVYIAIWRCCEWRISQHDWGISEPAFPGLLEQIRHFRGIVNAFPTKTHSLNRMVHPAWQTMKATLLQTTSTEFYDQKSFLERYIHDWVSL